MTNRERLREIKHWIVWDNSLASIPLKTLRIKGKGLRRLAQEIFACTELEALDFRPEREACLDYYLTELPPEVGRLTRLRILLLDTNELFELPREMTKLHSLEKLSLSNNKLRRLPVEFTLLTSLKSLHLSNNKIEEFPQQLCELSSLEFLDLSGNRLTSIPPEIRQLQNLHTLMLFHNDLQNLPESISEMDQLRCLWLGDNKLERLPRTFGNLRHLDWDDSTRHMMSTVIDGNPLIEPPLEVCKRGIKAIAEYFAERSSETESGAGVERKDIHGVVNGSPDNIYSQTTDSTRYEYIDSIPSLNDVTSSRQGKDEPEDKDSTKRNSVEVRFGQDVQGSSPSTSSPINRPPTPFPKQSQAAADAYKEGHSMKDNVDIDIYREQRDLVAPAEVNGYPKPVQDAPGAHGEPHRYSPTPTNIPKRSRADNNFDESATASGNDLRSTQRSPEYFKTAKETYAHGQGLPNSTNDRGGQQGLAETRYHQGHSGDQAAMKPQYERDNRHRERGPDIQGRSYSRSSKDSRELTPVAITKQEWLDIRAENNQSAGRTLSAQ